MAAKAGTLELLAREIATALRPLEQRLAENTRHEFLAQLGLRLPGGVAAAGGAIGAVVVQAGGLAPIIERLAGAIDGGDPKRIAGEGFALLNAIRTTVDAITAVGPALDAAVVAAPGLTDAQRTRLRAEATQLPKRLLDLVLITHVEARSRGLVDLLTIAGIIDSQPVLFDPADPTVVPGRRQVVRFDRLMSALTDPAGWLRDTFDFGNANFDGAKLFRAISDYFTAHDLDHSYFTPQGGSQVLDLYALRLTTNRTVLPPVMTAGLRLPLIADLVEKLPLSPLWTVVVQVHGRYDEGLTARITPPMTFELLPLTGELHVDASVGIEATSNEPIVLIGRTGSSRLEFTRFAIAVGVAADWTTAGPVSVEPSARMVLEGGHVLVDLSEGDGFISTLTGGGRFEADFDVQARWTPSGGLQLGGSGGVDLALPVHIELGPVEITTLYLSAGVADGGVPIEISGGFTASLGPISATVDRVGVVAVTRFTDGNLGPLDLEFGFKAPSGVGLSVHAGVVTGGGFLAYNEKTREYAGALELRFAGFLELKAIGLISTRMPDGSDGFSLLAVITTEFPGGLQLGLGFTLLGVGGVLGLHRRMNLDALVEGVRSGSIESVMFPRDIIANAPRILSDLRAFFPPEQGTFVVGPMAKIGWGTPALVTVSLAVIVEIPGNIAILGVLRCVLPSEHLPLLVLQVNFIGAIEFDKQRLWFYAELFDSRILFVTIEGGMGLLIGWGDDADLVLSVGGFHPSFTPPQLPFPVPPRISVDILNQPGQRITVAGYFAVTSNTVQFGASAQLVLGFEDFGLHGHLSFDALFQFSPFSFVIDIAAGVTLKAFGVGLFGIDLRLQLSGPAPWRARGSGSISLLFFEIEADFDISWGSKDNPTLPPIAVLPLLAGEVAKREGWQTRLPTGGTNPLVTLRPLDDTDLLVLHPLGTLFISQRAIPLNVTVDKVGAQRPSDGRRFTVAPASCSGLRQVAVTGDKFAMAQFQNMDDAAKLSRPAFEYQDAGLELAAAEQRLLSTRAARRSARYEMIVTDSRVRTAQTSTVRAVAAVPAPAKKRLYRPSVGVFTQLLEGSSTARSPLSQRDAEMRQPFPADQTVRLPGQRFVVALRRNNRQAFPPVAGGLVAGGTATFRSKTAAEDALAEWVRADARLAGALHVLPDTEASITPASPGTWSDAGPLPAATAFDANTEVLLRNGKVLVAGGRDSTGKAVAAAAVFDPAPGTWSATGELAQARERHTLTLLADGTVLAVGGRNASAPNGLGGAERYAPVAAAWTPLTHQPPTARYAHEATVLPTGDVLVTGGIGGRSLSTVELYRARAGTWEPNQKPMTDRRHGHRAVLISGGKVLVVGGAVTTGEAEVPLAYCEIYDPDTGMWTPTGSLAVPRAGHQATVLSDGTVLVTGGDGPMVAEDGTTRLSAVDTTERYDPATGEWTTVARLPGGRTHHRAVLLPTGTVAVIGGAATVPTAGYRAVTTYDPSTGIWTATGGLGSGRWDFAALPLADGRVLATGGNTRAGASAATGAATPTGHTEIFTP